MSISSEVLNNKYINQLLITIHIEYLLILYLICEIYFFFYFEGDPLY